jgi:phenylacetate-CoA ligase
VRARRLLWVDPTGACRETIIDAVPIFQPEVETLPRPELGRLQRERLRERFGVELEALPEQPFRVKSELRDAYPFGLLQVPL